MSEIPHIYEYACLDVMAFLLGKPENLIPVRCAQITQFTIKE
jgi:hypothetical protein